MKLLKRLSCLAFIVTGVELVWAQTNQMGAAAPTPILVTMDGQYLYFSKLYYPGYERPREPRSVVVVNFMGLKCLPCRKELPVFLETVRAASKSKKAAEMGMKIRYFVISVDPLSAKEPLRKFFEEQGIDPETEVLLDPYKKAAEKFGVDGIPRTFVISPMGKLVADVPWTGKDEQAYKKALLQGIAAALKDGMTKP